MGVSSNFISDHKEVLQLQLLLHNLTTYAIITHTVLFASSAIS